MRIIPTIQQIDKFLDDDYTLFRTQLLIMCIFIIHNAYLINEIENIDLTFTFQGYNITLFHALFCIAQPTIYELLVLILMRKGYKIAGIIYSFFILAANIFYFVFFGEEKKPYLLIFAVILSFLWNLSEVYHRRRKEKTTRITKVSQNDFTSNTNESDKESNTNKEKEKEKFTCDICGKPFFSKFSLNRHISTIHKNDKQH